MCRLMLSLYLLVRCFFSPLICMFLCSFFSVSSHVLTSGSEAAPLSNVCVPLLLAQTGYYDFPKIRKHFNPSNTDYFDCDLFRPPPHSPQTVLYANTRLVFILLFSSRSDETWMLESFPVMKALSHPPFSLSDVGLSLPIVLSCQSNFENALFKSKGQSGQTMTDAYQKNLNISHLCAIDSTHFLAYLSQIHLPASSARLTFLYSSFVFFFYTFLFNDLCVRVWIWMLHGLVNLYFGVVLVVYLHYNSRHC